MSFGVEKKQIFLYSDLFRNSFKEKIKSYFSKEASIDLYDFSKKETLNSELSVHTTICGSWLFLEALEATKDVTGNIAEVGCFEGGNMLLALKSSLIPEDKTVYLFDSFDGFPELTEFDPESFSKGDYKPTKDLQTINAKFEKYKNVKIIPGFVPETFSELDDSEKYSLIFFDCDLYQPCLDTLNYFWSKLTKGGIILLHDYFYEPGGFSGVEKATHEFCQAHNISPFGIWESTMAVLRKEH